MQPLFAEPNDLTIEPHVQEELLESLLVENDIFEHVVFEPIINDFTNGLIIIQNVFIHNHHNDRHVHNYQSDILVAMTTIVYLLEVYNPKTLVENPSF